jgi:hypothetical protein
VSEGIVSSRVIAQREPVELIEQRDDHTRVWQIGREVETTRPDGTRTVDMVKSYVHEKGSGLCYRDASAKFVPSVAEWREVPDGFVVDRCGYWLSVSKTIGSGLRYIVDGHELLLRAAYLMISDGVNEGHLAVLNPNATGFIVPGSPSVVRFPSALGPGYDLEYVAEKGGFHQNLIIAQRPVVPSRFDAAATAVYLYTEVNLDQYLAASGLKVLVDGEEINAGAPDLMSRPSVGGCISFHHAAATPGQTGALVHAFGLSEVRDSSSSVLPPSKTLAQKRVIRVSSNNAAYLVESLPFSYFAETPSAYPVVWDYVQKSGPITSSETWEPRYTYWVTADIALSATLAILPGTTVKLNPWTCIHVMGSQAKVVARAEPCNYITFTKASHSNCGEPIPGAPTGPWDFALNIYYGTSPDSLIQYCRFGHGTTGIYLRQSLTQPIAHNVFSDMYYALFVECCSATVHNNLMASCTDCAIYAYEADHTTYTNNAIDNTYCGIADAGSLSFVAADNLLSNCGLGIYTENPNGDIHHNRFYNVVTPIWGGNPYGNEELYSEPYDYSYIGSFFLDLDNPEVTEKLIDKGSRTAWDAGLGDGLFTVVAPESVFPGYHYQAETWSKVASDSAQSPVDIGYHHNRVDRYLPEACTFSGSGASLTITPGVVVGIRGDKYLMFTGGAKLVSVGDPAAGGLNLFTNSKSLSMNIESPRFGVTGVNPFILIDSSASEDTSIQFTRTMWMGWGILINYGRHLTQPIRDNIFSLSYMGIHAGLYSGNTLFNNLVHENVRGLYAWGNTEVANCTFDRNQTGLEVGADAGQKFTIRDSLFTKNSSQGILINASSGQVINYYNGFWENGTPITGGSPGPGSQVLAQSPYDAGIESGWQLHYKLKQDGGWPVTNSPVNAGSRWAPDPLEGPHPYSTSVYAERDVGRIDIGFHFTFYDNIDGDNLPDAWETHFFGNLDQGDNSIFGDSDNLTALQEFWHGSSPKAPDSDGDGYADDQEVGPRAGVEASRKLCRGWGPAVYDFKAGPWLTNVSSSGVTIAWWVPYRPIPIPKDIYYKKETDSTFTRVYGEDIATRDLGTEGKVYEKRLTGLSSGIVYQYYVQCTIDGSLSKSPVCRFRTLESAPSSLTFIVYGDNRGDDDPQKPPKYNGGGFNEYAADVARGILAKAGDARFIIHVGDFTQHGGTAEEWRQHFFLTTTRLIAEYPLFPVRGNHESSLAYYDDFFDYPGDLNNAGYPTWYYFDSGDCRFIVLDYRAGLLTTGQQYRDAIYYSGPPQRGWLWQSNATFKFVLIHEPPFTNAPDGHHWDYGDITYVRQKLATDNPALSTYACRACFSGHNHLYERYLHLGVDYIVTGGAGAPLHTHSDDPPAEFAAEAHSNSFNFCRVDVDVAESEATLSVYTVSGATISQLEQYEL